MKNVVIVTNAPAPYRAAFFNYIQKKKSNYLFHIIYASKNHQIGRQWNVNEKELGNHTFLNCRVLTFHRKYDDKRIVFSVGAAKKLAQLKPDLVVCMEYNATILQTVFWCRRKKVPYLSWTDGTDNSERSIKKMQKLFRRYVIGNAAGFISSSSAAMEHQIHFGAERQLCHKSLLTVDIEKYLMKKESSYEPQKRLLYVGSLIGRKGLDLLISALEYTNKEIQLTVVGEGSEEEALKALAKQHGVDKRIHWRGFLHGDALKECYQNNDVFVLPTREDCYGLVILEAMCASLAVIASKYADGAFDLIENGVHGAIVDPYDAKELAQAVNDIFAQKEVLLKMQKACYVRAQQFSFENVSKGFYEALDAALM